jgi:hypothetical protein
MTRNYLSRLLIPLLASLPLLLPAPLLANELVKLQWEELVPADWDPFSELEELGIGDMADDDPRMREAQAVLDALWSQAPVIEEYAGKRVQLEGFVVPLENKGKKISEFLLVPYFGACIHVPPPPANQTVYVKTAPGEEYPGALYDVVVVTGRMAIERTKNDMGDSGYRIDAEMIKPYEE